ncbi:hypothetical protein PLESTF_001655400 [Pleodorina starrii]|nr:hypothetical protein PLESTF_001655400 [Pleodorina starrii]
MEENGISTLALLGDLADAYEKCRLTGADPPQLFRSRSSADRRQVLSLARCDLPQPTPSPNPQMNLNLRIGPTAGTAGLRTSGAVTDDFNSPPSAGGSSPAAAGTPKASQLPPPPPLHQLLQLQPDLNCRTSFDLSHHTRRTSWASQPATATPVAPSPPPPSLATPPLLLRGRSLQRYDSNPGASYDEDSLLSPMASEALGARRLSERGISPRVAAGGGGGGPPPSRSGRFMARSQSGALPSSPFLVPPAPPDTGAGGGGSAGGTLCSAVGAPPSPAAAGGVTGGGAGGGVSSSGSPLVPTPRGGLPTTARGILFFQSSRSISGSTLMQPFGNDRSGRNRSSSTSGVAAGAAATAKATLGGAAASSSAATGGGGGGGSLGSGGGAPQPQPTADSSMQRFPLAMPGPSGLPAVLPAPRRSLQGLPPGSGGGSGGGAGGGGSGIRSVNSRLSTSEWL